LDTAKYGYHVHGNDAFYQLDDAFTAPLDDAIGQTYPKVSGKTPDYYILPKLRALKGTSQMQECL